MVYDRRRLETEVVSSDSDDDDVVTGPEVVPVLDRRDSSDFINEIRSRVNGIVERDVMSGRIRRRGEPGAAGNTLF